MRAEQRLSDCNQKLWVAYRHDLKIRQLSVATISHYFQSIQDADRFFAASFESLSRLDIKAYLAERSETLSDSTVHIRWVDLKIFFRWMVAEELLVKSPMDGIAEPQVVDNPPRIAPDADLVKLLKACAGTGFRERRDTALIRLMLEPGGPRRAEIIRLSLDDLDLDNELLMIHGKGGKIRYMPYGAKTGQALMRYLHLRKNHKHSGSEKLWLGRFGPLSIYALGQILEVRCASAGIERIKPHGLRHVAADKAMAAGISDLDMQTLFGWSSGRMLAVYARSNRSARAIASARAKSVGDSL